MSKAFIPHEHKRGGRGKWVKFELANPKELKILTVVGGRARVATITDPVEIETFLRKAQHAVDGRLVGIFIPAGRSRVPGGERAVKGPDGKPVLNPDGTPKKEAFPEEWVSVPASVAPQRAVLGPDGEQNMAWVANGQVHRLLLTFDSLKNVELSIDRADIPKHRDATLDKDFDPKLSARR